MKNFESLFAELQAKAAAGNPDSGTVKELQKGTHFICKKTEFFYELDSARASTESTPGFDRHGCFLPDFCSFTVPNRVGTLGF